MTEKKKKRLIVVKRKGFTLIYPAGKKPPRIKENPLKPLEHFVGATLQNGDLVSDRPEKEVKKHGKKA